MKFIFGIALFLAISLLSVGAHIVAMSDHKCPLCGEKFKAMTDVSGTQLGMRLDMKPLGPIAAPWSVPECPKCHFILFKNEDEKYTSKEKASLKSLIGTKEYKSPPKGTDTYYRLGLIREQQKESSYTTGHTFLEASWQCEDKSDAYRACLTRSARWFDDFIKANSATKGKSEDMKTALFLRGEIHRLLGEFDTAKVRFEKLKADKDFQGKPYGLMISQELKLIGLHNPKPAEIERPKKK